MVCFNGMLDSFTINYVTRLYTYHFDLDHLSMRLSSTRKISSKLRCIMVILSSD